MSKIKFCSVVFGVTLRLLATNTSFFVSRKQQTMPLIATRGQCHQFTTVWCSCIHNTWCCTNDNTRWSQIFVEKRDFCLPHLYSNSPLGTPRRNIVRGSPPEYCHNVRYGKLEWCGYPMAKKIWRYVYSFRQNTRMWQTDGRADRHCITA